MQLAHLVVPKNGSPSLYAASQSLYDVIIVIIIISKNYYFPYEESWI